MAGNWSRFHLELVSSSKSAEVLRIKSIATKIEVILVGIKCQKHFAKAVGRDSTSFQFDVTDEKFDAIDCLPIEDFPPTLSPR